MSSSREAAKAPRPAVVGEVLFDRFPDGRRVLGGAPFNVAWNLRGFGFDPLFLSAVGDDDEGREIRSRMNDWGLDDAWLETIPEAPTGEVRVTLAGSEPTYEILRDRAYDRVTAPDDAAGRKDVGLLYHGSLAWRSETTRQAMREVRASLDVPVFVDVNVRKGSFDLDWLGELIGGATWVKLNRDELSLIATLDLVDDDAIERAVASLRDRFGCRNVWLTCGEDGAYGFHIDASGNRRTVHADAPRRTEVVDTVGAGDAFAAVAIAGALTGEDPQRTLERAVRFAARVCGLRGAVSDDRTFYETYHDATFATESDR